MGLLVRHPAGWSEWSNYWDGADQYRILLELKGQLVSWDRHESDQIPGPDNNDSEWDQESGTSGESRFCRGLTGCRLLGTHDGEVLCRAGAGITLLPGRKEDRPRRDEPVDLLAEIIADCDR